MNRRPEGVSPYRRTAALGATMMLLALPAGCKVGADAPPSLVEIESFVGTALPPNLQDLHVADEAGIDRLMRLRFDAPDEEAAGFAARLMPKGLEPATNSGLAIMGSDLGWWIDAVLPGAEGGETTTAATRTIKLISAPISPRTRRLWLAVFTQ